MRELFAGGTNLESLGNTVTHHIVNDKEFQEDLTETASPVSAIPIANSPNQPLPHQIPRHILERLIAVPCPLPRHFQHALANNVPLNLVRPARD
jgi:hypothetical protein